MKRARNECAMAGCPKGYRINSRNEDTILSIKERVLSVSRRIEVKE